MISLLLPRWIKSLLGKLLYRAQRRPMLCPDCGRNIPSPTISPEALWDSRVDCPECHATFSLLVTKSLAPSSEERAAFTSERQELPKPDDTKIEVAEKDGVIGWRIPSKGGCNFFVFFGAIWLCITTTVFWAVFFGNAASGTPAIPMLMACLFLAIGFIVLYVGIRMNRIQHWLWITDTALLHEQKFILTKRRIFQRSSIQSVELVVVYTQNYEPVYGIEIVSSEGKLRLGTALRPADKAWLCQDIRRVLGLAEPAAIVASARNLSSTRLTPWGATIRIDSELGSCTLAGPIGSTGLAPVILAIIFAAFPAIMILNGPGFISTDHHPLPFLVFEWIFAIVWYVPLTLIMLLGLGIAWTAWRFRKTEYTIKTDHNGLVVQIRNSSHLMMEKHWPPSDIGDVKIRCATSSRQQPSQALIVHRLEVTLPDRILGIGYGGDLKQLKEAETALLTVLDRIPKVEA